MKFFKLSFICLLSVLLFAGCSALSSLPEDIQTTPDNPQLEVVYSSTIPGYSGQDVIEINGNKASFTSEEITTESFESYSPLDSLGRVGTAYACLSQDTLPTEERGDISAIHPTGWNQNTYSFIEGEKLYNRSHLIAYSLSAENENEANLMTGTDHLNKELMVPYENKVLDYIEKTGNHVMYRITPKFTGDNLLADGVQIEAYSVEDQGEGINFNVFCYNVEPGVIINYVDGSNEIDPNNKISAQASQDPSKDEVREYIVNTKSKKIHLPECDGVAKMNEKNKETVNKSLNELYSEGYSNCGSCRPEVN